MQAYNKAIAAVIVPGILWALNEFGVSADMLVGDAVGLLVNVALTAFAVWAVPNKK